MPIKLRGNQTTGPSPAKTDEWSGPWGRINPAPHSVETLRICTGAEVEEFHSYPYRVLSSWHLRGVGGHREELKIEAGPDLITVTGRGLSRIVAALDQGALEIISEVPGAAEMLANDKIIVTNITMEGARQ